MWRCESASAQGAKTEADRRHSLALAGRDGERKFELKVSKSESKLVYGHIPQRFRVLRASICVGQSCATRAGRRPLRIELHLARTSSSVCGITADAAHPEAEQRSSVKLYPSVATPRDRVFHHDQNLVDRRAMQR